MIWGKACDRRGRGHYDLQSYVGRQTREHRPCTVRMRQQPQGCRERLKASVPAIPQPVSHKLQRWEQRPCHAVGVIHASGSCLLENPHGGCTENC